MIAIIYSQYFSSRYEFTSLAAALTRRLSSKRDLLLIPIEELHLQIDADGVRFVLGDHYIPVQSVQSAIVIDLGQLTLTSLSYRYYALRLLNESGIRVINRPDTILLCRNKLATAAILQRKGIPFVASLAGSNVATLMGALQTHTPNEEIILKPVDGSRGEGVTSTSWATAEADISRALTSHEIILLQPRILSERSCDWRLLVLGGAIIGTMKRFARPGHVASNVDKSGFLLAASPPEDVACLARAAARAVGGELISVDIITDRRTGCHYVLEVNGFGRWQALEGIAKIDFASIITDYLLSGVAGS